MCNCITDIEVKVLDKLKNESGGDISDLEMKNTGFSFGENPRQRTFNDVQYKLTPKKKDGAMGKAVTKSISVYHTYCPFCGSKQIK
jgi:hypothetical protein